MGLRVVTRWGTSSRVPVTCAFELQCVGADGSDYFARRLGYGPHSGRTVLFQRSWCKWRWTLSALERLIVLGMIGHPSLKAFLLRFDLLASLAMEESLEFHTTTTLTAMR